MRESPKTSFAHEQSSGHSLSSRCLIDDPIPGWRKLARQKADLTYRGELPMPELAGRTVRVVHASVILQNRKVHELFRLDASEWKFDGEGRVDQEEVRRYLQQWANNLSPEGRVRTRIKTPQLSSLDVASIRRCLGLPETSS